MTSSDTATLSSDEDDDDTNFDTENSYSSQQHKKKFPNTNKYFSSPTKVNSPPKSDSLLDDSYCIQNRKFLMEKQDFTLFDSDDLNKLLGHLREYSTYCAMHRNYNEAKSSDRLFDQIQYELIQRSIPLSRQIEIENSFELQKAEEIEKLDEELKEYDEETQNKKVTMLKKHIEESNTFEKIWREEKPLKYRKASSKLLFLLASEKRSARIGQYDEANMYKKEAEKLAEIETKSQQSLLNRDYKIAKQKFAQKQEEELKILVESRSEYREFILTRRRASLETICKRQNILTYRSFQVPKTANKLKPFYKVSGNASKQLYDDHITSFENPISPLTAPNDDEVVDKEEKEKLINQMKFKQMKEEPKSDQVKLSTTTSDLSSASASPSAYKKVQKKPQTGAVLSSPKNQAPKKVKTIKIKSFSNNKPELLKSKDVKSSANGDNNSSSSVISRNIKKLNTTNNNVSQSSSISKKSLKKDSEKDEIQRNDKKTEENFSSKKRTSSEARRSVSSASSNSLTKKGKNKNEISSSEKNSQEINTDFDDEKEDNNESANGTESNQTNNRQQTKTKNDELSDSFSFTSGSSKNKKEKPNSLSEDDSEYDAKSDKKSNASIGSDDFLDNEGVFETQVK